MKIRLTFKTPDVIDQLEDFSTDMQEAFLPIIRKFVKYDEYVTIEIDTDTSTATVVPVK